MVEKFRIGQGSDLHRLVLNEKLILGGIRIESKLGCLAHSDGDVLIHAIIDALLGALSLGDIGTIFPNSEQKYKNIASEILLHEVVQLVNSKGYELNNLDTTIKLQTPKVQEYIYQIRTNLSKILSTDIDKISVKAKTGEEIGIIGESKAISCDAVLLLTARS